MATGRTTRGFRKRTDTPQLPTAGSGWLHPGSGREGEEEPMNLDFDQLQHAGESLHAGGFRGEVGMFLVKDQAAKPQAKSDAPGLRLSRVRSTVRNGTSSPRRSIFLRNRLASRCGRMLRVSLNVSQINKLYPIDRFSCSVGARSYGPKFATTKRALGIGVLSAKMPSSGTNGDQTAPISHHSKRHVHGAFCSQLPSRFLETVSSHFDFAGKFWWALQGLNLRPLPCEGTTGL
jgi:hypothetical protein